MTPAPDAGLDGMGRAPGKQRAPSRRTGTAMAAEAATFALASAAHLAASFTVAAVPELLIAAVLGLGSSAVLSQRPHAWGAAAGTTSFATLGTIVGLTIIATGRQDTPDLAYHATILAALAATLAALWRRRDAAVRPTAQKPAGEQRRDQPAAAALRTSGQRGQRDVRQREDSADDSTACGLARGGADVSA